MLAALMNPIFARFRTTEPLTKLHPRYAPSAPWEKPKPEEEATAEPPRRARDSANRSPLWCTVH